MSESADFHKDVLLFRADRAQAHRFTKFRNLRYLLWGSLFTFGAFVDFQGIRIIEIPILELLGIPKIPYLIAVLVLAVFTFFVHFYSSIFKRFGHILVYTDHLEISDGEVIERHRFNEMTKIEIIRGATYHYEYQSDNKLIKVSNFFKYSIHSNREEIEFCLDSEFHNKQFEMMLKLLRRAGVSFLYKSI